MAIPAAYVPIIKWQSGRVSADWYTFLSDLSGGAVTASDADALNGYSGSFYLDRSNQTGTQTASTISDFSSAVDARIAASGAGNSYNPGGW